MIEGLEHCTCEERQRAGNIQPKEKVNKKILINVCNTCREDGKKMEPGSFWWFPGTEVKGTN